MLASLIIQNAYKITILYLFKLAKIKKVNVIMLAPLYTMEKRGNHATFLQGSSAICIKSTTAHTL